MNGYNVHVATKIDDVDKEQWNHVVKSNDGTVFHTYEWLKTHEDGGTSKFSPFYVMIFKGDKLIGVSPFYLTTYCPRLELYKKNLLLDKSKVFNEPILLGHTLHGQYSQILSTEDKKNVNSLVLDTLYNICKENDYKIFGFPMIHRSDSSLLEELKNRKFLTRYFNSVNRLYVKWKDIDDYFNSFDTSKKRYKMKRIISDCESRGISFIEGFENISVAEIAALSEKTCKHHGSPLFFTERFLECILDGLKLFTTVMSVKLGDKLIGTTILLNFNGVLTPWVIGLDYDYLKECNHYNYLCIKWIEYAVNNNLRRIEFGRGTFYIKAKYACRREEIFISLKGVDEESSTIAENWINEIERSSLKTLNDFHRKIGMNEVRLEDLR